MDAIKKKITLLKEDNEQFQEEIERLQEQFHHSFLVYYSHLFIGDCENRPLVNLMIRLSWKKKGRNVKVLKMKQQWKSRNLNMTTKLLKLKSMLLKQRKVISKVR